MPNGAASRRGAFPSRRSLREAPAYPSRRSLRAAPAFPTRRSLRESLRESLPEVEPTVHLEADASEPVAPENPIAPLEAPGAGQHGGTSAFLTLPLVAIPIPSHATEVTAPPRGTRMLRKSLAATSGLVCALGLLLTGMVPALGEAEAGEPAAALPHQELAGSFGDLTTAGPASALGSVAAEPSGGPVAFVNFPDARVQFPFATGQELTDGFGPRTYPVAGMHEAQDFAAPDGTTVQAIADGRVLETGEPAGVATPLSGERGLRGVLPDLPA